MARADVWLRGDSDEADWAQARALRLITAAMGGTETLVDETARVLSEALNADETSESLERLAHLSTMLAAVAAREIRLVSEAEGIDFNEYVESIDSMMTDLRSRESEPDAPS